MAVKDKTKEKARKALYYQKVRHAPEFVAKHSARRLHNRHAMSVEQYNQLLEEQGGGCAICGLRPFPSVLCVDHDHTCCPGKDSCGRCTRGILCRKCNLLLGNACDDVNRLRKAIAYLEQQG